MDIPSPNSFTRKELKCLLLMRKRPRTFSELKAALGVEDEAMNFMLSNMLTYKLIYTESGKFTVDPIKLNQRGETVAQAEYDRRFDMYYTRIISFVALILSAASVITAIIALRAK